MASSKLTRHDFSDGGLRFFGKSEFKNETYAINPDDHGEIYFGVYNSDDKKNVFNNYVDYSGAMSLTIDEAEDIIHALQESIKFIKEEA